jgi:hypothetical protein
MAEMKFNVKGPVGIIVTLIAVAGFLYYQFFMPVYFDSAEKRAIVNEIEIARITELSETSSRTLELYKKTGKYRGDLAKIKALCGKIKLKDIKSKRSLLGGVKIKVTYTITNKTTKATTAVIYFKVYYNKSSKSHLRGRMNLYKITKHEYNK